MTEQKIKEMKTIPKILSIEDLAKELHESGREAVEKRKVVVKNPKFAKFLEWDEITEDAREGRRIQARYLCRNFNIFYKGGR